MHLKQIIRSISFLFLLLSLSSCIQTKTFTTDQVGLDQLKSPLYCGTYSSYVYFNKENIAQFNDSMTYLGNRLYDSIIRRRIRKIEFPKNEFVTDTAIATKLSKELLSVVSYAEKNEKIKNYEVSDVFKTVTAKYSNTHYFFLVPTGYIRSNAAVRKIKNEQKDHTNEAVIAMVVGSILATALTGGTYLFVFIPKGTHIKQRGSNCHLIVYNKTKNEISLYRRQFFTDNEITPLQRKHLKNQVEYILKEYL